MTVPDLDPNPTAGDRKRAGMAVRAWVQNDLRMLGYLTAEATEEHRGYHLLAALCAQLAEILKLRGDEEAMKRLERAIARYAAEEAEDIARRTATRDDG
ncbi:hypothetical protein [Mycobacterium sp. SMC-4]|uniref:hypothetical protein n=1 Tax=Mycobacterium sp. SMC-4 TaxID=2857059 RepID=UPI0021B3FC4C|nr:hypothetical protein [Mycobacterium sp. SMC-4]UXA19824.1 hypothetical protein KXD98_09660 [Mycobacterium sp. SMC-4]